MTTTPDSSPLPRLTVNIGITGHRRIEPAREAALRQELRAFLSLVMEQVQQLLQQEGVCALVRELYAPQPPRFVLLSALAAGADSLAAEEALALGYELHAPLPMAREEYEKDFDTAESLASFRHLLSKVQENHLFEIAAANPERGHAYADASAVVLNHSDVLLALWNGQDTEYIAGTCATIEQASRQHIPVIHLHSESGEMCIMTDGERYADWQERLRKHFHSLLLPVEALSAEKDLAFTRACARQKRVSADDWFPQYLFLPGLFFRTEKAVGSFIRWFAPRPKLPDKVGTVDGGDAFARKNPGCIERLRELFTCFDIFSNAYSVRYRSGLLWRYLAPVIAIAFLSCALYWRTWYPDWEKERLDNWVTLWFALQGLFLLLPLILQALDRWKLWHRKFFSYRVVGEQLRQTMYLGAVGFLTVRPSTCTYTESPQRWTAWYYRALMRHVGLPGATVDRRYLLDWLLWTRNDFVVDQLNYHARRWRREGNMRRKLAFLGTLMFAAGIAAAFIRWGMTMKDCSDASMSFTSVCTMVFPSLAVFFAGFCAYACYAKNQQVSMESSTTLGTICHEMDGFLRASGCDVAPPLGASALLPQPLHFSHAYKLAGQINDCCKGELLGWEDLISARDIRGL